MLIGTSATLGVVPALVKNPGYDPVKSFAPVAKISDSTTILVVPPNFPANSVAELVAYAKANPGKLSYASAGHGNQTQLAAELLLARAGIKAVHVPYKSGAEMVTAVLSEQVQMTFPDISILLGLIQDKKIKALAVTSAARHPQLPDVPTMAESGIADYVTTFWTGVIVPAGTPPDIVNKLNAAINDGLKSPSVADSLGRRRRAARARLAAGVRQLHRRRDAQMGRHRQDRRHRSAMSGAGFRAEQRRVSRSGILANVRANAPTLSACAGRSQWPSSGCFVPDRLHPGFRPALWLRAAPRP